MWIIHTYVYDFAGAISPSSLSRSAVDILIRFPSPGRSYKYPSRSKSSLLWIRGVFIDLPSRIFDPSICSISLSSTSQLLICFPLLVGLGWGVEVVRRGIIYRSECNFSWYLLFTDGKSCYFPCVRSSQLSGSKRHSPFSTPTRACAFPCWEERREKILQLTGLPERHQFLL